MKVILLKDVESLGKADSLVLVSDGHARNYLFPKKFAATATPQNIAAAEKRKKERLAQLEKQKEEFKALADKLSAMEISIIAPCGEEGKLFGSVTAADIAEAIQAQAGIEVDKRKIDLSEPLKTTGEHKIAVAIFQDIKANLKVNVKAKS
jgi:large subunit ribosomal protein L9